MNAGLASGHRCEFDDEATVPVVGRPRHDPFIPRTENLALLKDRCIGE